MTSELKISVVVFSSSFLVDDLFQTIGSENYKVGYQYLNTYNFGIVFSTIPLVISTIF